jgi:hypothetical protein
MYALYKDYNPKMHGVYYEQEAYTTKTKTYTEAKSKSKSTGF